MSDTRPLNLTAEEAFVWRLFIKSPMFKLSCTHRWYSLRIMLWCINEQHRMRILHLIKLWWRVVSSQVPLVLILPVWTSYLWELSSVWSLFVYCIVVCHILVSLCFFFNYHLGVQDKHWTLINSRHANASSAVKFNGLVSDIFETQQGDRQGES
jgi:glucan phosphoethanolaminetransferase (alkaline phosphatase superfamily)